MRRRASSVLLAAAVGVLFQACSSASDPAPPPIVVPPLLKLGKPLASASAKVTAAGGGTVTWPALGDLPGGQLVFPPGAVSADTTVTVGTYDGGDAWGGDAVFYQFAPEGLALAQPAQLTIGYREAWVKRMGFPETDLRMVHVSGPRSNGASTETVEAFPPDSWDQAGHTATFSIRHFSTGGFDFGQGVQKILDAANPVNQAQMLAADVGGIGGAIGGAISGGLTTMQRLITKARKVGAPDGDTCPDDCNGGNANVGGDSCASNTFIEAGPGDTFWDGSTDKPKFLLIHGVISSYRELVPMAKALRRAFNGNAEVRFYDYPSGQHIEDNAAALASVVQSRAQAGFKMNLVVHSMGGLVSRMAIEKYGMSRYVGSLVTLGTPHQGAVLSMEGLSVYAAVFGPLGVASLLAPPFDGFVDLAPASPFMAKLADGGPWGDEGIPYFAVWTPEDHLIVSDPNSQQGIPSLAGSVTRQSETTEALPPNAAHGDLASPCKPTPPVADSIHTWVCQSNRGASYCPQPAAGGGGSCDAPAVASCLVSGTGLCQEFSAAFLADTAAAGSPLGTPQDICEKTFKSPWSHAPCAAAGRIGRCPIRCDKPDGFVEVFYPVASLTPAQSLANAMKSCADAMGSFQPN